MKKALLITILSALILAGCGRVVNKGNNSKVETTTTSALTIEVTSTEITDETKASKLSSSAKVKATTTKKSVAKDDKVRVVSNTTQQNIQSNDNKVQSIQPACTNTTKNSAKKNMITTATKVVTTITTKPVITTVAKPKIVTTTIKAKQNVKWSKQMKAWKKLAIGQSLSSNEEKLIRTDIIEYGLKKFNGKQTVTCRCGGDVKAVKFLSPLNVTANYSWNDFSHAHMDACSDVESVSLIKNAKSDKEIYSIVDKARADCLEVVDNGIASWHDFYDENGGLKYASDIEFSVMIDGTYVWFLTK